jgi:hypothetical protein
MGAGNGGRELRLVAAVLAAVLVLAGGCRFQERQPAAGEPTWLESTGHEQAPTLARHLRGLDVAMVEIDHRYAELFFAAEDRNWPYAAYQIDKLRLVMDLAIQRRPRREASARAFYFPFLQKLEEAVLAEDAAAFANGFQAFTDACQACHVAEQVPTFGVRLPTERRSSIGLP